MGDTSNRIRDLEVRIRDLISHPRLQHALIQDLGTWNVLCSSLDVIGDTELAISSYEALPDIDDEGTRYLVVYGILQVLFVQQDAAGHILKSLTGEALESDPDLVYVREIRNRATGHPAKRERRTNQGFPQRSHFIARFSLCTKGFHLLTTDEDGKTEFTEVEIQDLIQRQRAGVVRLLTNAARKLREREVEHRNTFKDKKLADIFPEALDYYVGKVFEACHGDNNRRVFGCGMVDSIAKIVTQFKDALTERGILPAYNALQQDIGDVQYPLDELRAYFTGATESTLNERSSDIFAFFVRHKLHELKRVAQEFDAEYASEVPV